MSAKTSTQPGRRTPLSLTGAVTKGQSNKGGSNAASNSGNSANGHSTANNNKQDNKLQHQKTEQQKNSNTDTKENPNNSNKKAHQQSEKKQQQQQNDNNKKSIEKNQNGINNTSKQHQQQTNENKQSQQQPKDSKQQNGNDNKLNENDKKEKPEKEQDKTEKIETKAKEDKKSDLEKQETNKKEEKKTKELKDINDTKKMDTIETANRVMEVSGQNELHEKRSDDKILKDEKDDQVANPKSEEEKNDSMEVVEEQQQLQQKSSLATPKSNKANKSSAALNKTPTEKTPQKMTFSNVTIKTSQVTKREVTTTIDDVDMEPLTVEGSPIKTTQPEEVANLNIAPSATSTPGKILLSKRHSAVPKSDVQLAMQSSAYSTERPRGLSQISGRKSIRQITDYTPSKFHSNSQFRESYRRINTELDVTNTSINVTVGSEAPSNLSFSFFGRGRKRERTPPQLSQSAIGELHTDVEVSPPKKARLEGFFSVVSSPLTLLRNRFSKATLQSSTPVNLQQKLNAAEDEIEVQNVSGLSIQEDLSKTEKEMEMSVASNNEVDGDTDEAKSNSAIKEVLENKDCNEVSLKSEISCGVEQSCETSDIKITETLLKPAVGDPLNKNKRFLKTYNNK
ncbi:hypothetical protein DOY81_006736 [Sarcophaga bullata]|nr:hypothetical protein DOY81_006736 [Sarcophaga bullata]